MRTRLSPGCEPLGPRSPRRALLALAAGALALSSACGSGGSGAAGPSNAASNDTGDSGGRKLPGIKEFGLNEEEFAAHIEKVQATIAKCMTDAGFEYVPVDVPTVEAAQARVRHDPGVSRREYHERWGWGQSTRFDNPVRDTGMGPQNLRYLNSLSEANQEAYNRTLYGEDQDANFVWTFDEEDFSHTGGCTRKGVVAAFTPAQVKGTYVNPKDVLIEEDPRIVEAWRKWSKCMRAQGLDYPDQDDAIEEFEERSDEIIGDDDPTKLTGERAAALKRVQQQEISVSLIDMECQIKYTDDLVRQVEIEVFGQPVSG